MGASERPDDEGATKGAVWLSGDGRRWERLGQNDFPESLLAAVTRGPGGYLAVGRIATNPAQAETVAGAWTSSDGRSWRRSPANEAFASRASNLVTVTPGGPGFVAGGRRYEDGGFKPLVVVSNDGISWHRAKIDMGPARGAVAGICAGPFGLVAVGPEFQPERDRSAVWRSDDGETWERVESSAFAEPEQTLSACTVTADGAVVASGWQRFSGRRTAVFWRSVDGRSWERQQLERSTADHFGDLVADVLFATGGLVIAAGFDTSGGDADLVVWVSRDGKAWARVPHDEAIFGGWGNQVPSSIAVNGQTVLISGTDDKAGALWVTDVPTLTRLAPS